MTNISLIKEISWVLSMASAQNKLDIPGEYIWAFPKDISFSEIQARSRSIFSSGNAIKDPTVINYIQNLNLSKHLLDPWITKKFEEKFFSWVSNSNNHNLKNLNEFKYSGFSAGTQESFINFYMVNRKKRFRVFQGDYWWHMDIWSKLNLDWEYIENDSIKENDICICSYPFALTGKKHENFEWLLSECNKKGCKILIDFIYLPNSNKEVSVDLSNECIDEITFSFSKTFPVQCAKIAGRLKKTKPEDPMQMSNDENICNRLSSGLAYDIMCEFPMDFMIGKYINKQKYWCEKLGLTPTPVVHFGIGDDYTEYGNDGDKAWCSPYNMQKNRYNLGILYENEELLKNLGYL